MSDFDFYKILGVARDATREEIKKAYRDLAIKFHPDKVNSVLADEMMKKINSANETLSDPKKRLAYNISLKPEKSKNSKSKSKYSKTNRSKIISSLKKMYVVYSRQSKIMVREFSRLVAEYQNSQRRNSKTVQESQDNVIHHYHHFDDYNKKSQRRRKRSKHNDYGFNSGVFDF